MRIMATSDLHGNLEGLNPTGADVVVLAGDIAPLKGRGVWHVNDQKKWIKLTEAIIDKRPRFVFCGHIHTGRHGGVDFEGSRIYNVSRVDENYEIAYPPTWVEV